MKKFKELVNEIYEPNTPDEAKFVNMHNVKTFDYPVKNDHGLPFRDDRIKTAGPQHKKPATYDPPKEPATVYTKANEEVVDEGKAEDDAVKAYLAKGGKVTVGKTKNAKGIEYMRGMSRQKGSSAAAKMSYKEEAEIIEKKLPSMHVYVTPTGAGKHEVVTLSHDVEADHPSKPGTPLEPGHTLSDKDVQALKKSGHTVASDTELDEKTLTPAEMKKREEVAKAIKREHPGMPMAMKMAIATKTAKRVAEETAELRLLMGLNPESDINEAFETDDILSLLQVVSDKDTVAEIFLEEGEDGLLIDKEVADILLAVYESLDEESREKFEYALTESYAGFDYCVDFSVKFLEEETE